MPMVDFTLEDVRATVKGELIEERAYTWAMIDESIGEAKSEMMGELKRVRRMLEEDYRVESDRLMRHMADPKAHAA